MAWRVHGLEIRVQVPLDSSSLSKIFCKLNFSNDLKQMLLILILVKIVISIHSFGACQKRSGCNRATYSGCCKKRRPADARGVELVLKQKQGENIESLRQNKNIQVASALLEEKMKAARMPLHPGQGKTQHKVLEPFLDLVPPGILKKNKLGDAIAISNLKLSLTH